MGRNGRKTHKLPLLSLSKLRKDKGTLDFKEMFKEFIESESKRLNMALAYGYGEVDLFGDEYDALWAYYGQGYKFNKARQTSHRYPQNAIGNRAVVKKYLGNHTHTKAGQKHLWQQGFVPSQIEDAEVINDDKPASLIEQHFGEDEKASDPITIYFYKDFKTESDVEVFTNLVEFDQFVQDMGITITEEVCLQILQSDEIHCSIDPYYWYKTGDQYLICASSYIDLEWECHDRTADVEDEIDTYGHDPMYARSNCFWD